MQRFSSLERFRNYLEMLARLALPPWLQSRFDPADFVQEAMVKAHENMGQCRGQSDAELAGGCAIRGENPHIHN